MSKRKHMPTSTKLDAALNALGMLGVEINWDHNPPLALREKILNDDGEVIGYIPDENDPRYIVPMIKADHLKKTNGKRHDVSNGDIHKIAKASRLGKKTEEFRRRLASPEETAEVPKQEKRNGFGRKSDPQRRASRPLTKWAAWRSE